MADVGYLFEGNLMVARFQNGVFGGFADPLNATKFELKFSGERKDRISKRRAQYGQAVDSVAIPKPVECSIEVDSAGDAEILAMAVMGENLTVASAANATVTDASFTVLALNVWLPIFGHRNITNMTVKNPDDSSLASTNYAIYNFETGMVKFTGGVTVGDVVKLSYSHHEEGHIVTNSMTNSLIKSRLFFDGKNLADGKNVTVDVWEVAFSSQATLDFMSGDFMKVPLTGTCNTPNGKNSPFEIKNY